MVAELLLKPAAAAPPSPSSVRLDLLAGQAQPERAAQISYLHYMRGFEADAPRFYRREGDYTLALTIAAAWVGVPQAAGADPHRRRPAGQPDHAGQRRRNRDVPHVFSSGMPPNPSTGAPGPPRRMPTAPAARKIAIETTADRRRRYPPGDRPAGGTRGGGARRRSARRRSCWPAKQSPARAGTAAGQRPGRPEIQRLRRRDPKPAQRRAGPGRPRPRSIASARAVRRTG